MEEAEASLVRHMARGGRHIVGSMEQFGSRRAGMAVDLENHMACYLEAEGTGMDMGMGIGLGVVDIEAEGLMWVLVLAVGVIRQ